MAVYRYLRLFINIKYTDEVVAKVCTLSALNVKEKHQKSGKINPTSLNETCLCDSNLEFILFFLLSSGTAWQTLLLYIDDLRQNGNLCVCV